MKRNPVVATLRPAAASAGSGMLATRPSIRDAGARSKGRPATVEPEPLPPAMLPAEILFCLRDVKGYWSTPHITPREMEYLEQQDLIERAPTGLCAIRLTKHGAAVKNGGRPAPGEHSKATISRSSNDRQPPARKPIQSKESSIL